MSLLSWNCRGRGNPQTVNALKKVIKLEKPKFIFLMETKSDDDWMKVIRDCCGFQKGFFVPSIGSSGGLALFWDSKVRIKVVGSCLSHIDAIVERDGNYSLWRLTGFYGNPETSKRMESWQLLNSLSSTSQLPWLVNGDFNEIWCAEEKEG